MKVNNKEEFDKLNVFGLGNANTAFAEYFIGNSYLNPLTDPKECAVFLAAVIIGIFIMRKAEADRF